MYTCAGSYMLLIPVSFPGPMQVIVWNAARLPSHTNTIPHLLTSSLARPLKLPM